MFDRVPVVDGVSAAVTVTESLRDWACTSTARTYAAPRKKSITGWPLAGGEGNRS